MNNISKTSSSNFILNQGSDRQKIKKAALEFESIMLQQLLKQAQPKMSEGLFGGGMGENFFQDHLTQERARIMSQQGGIGLAKMLERELLNQADLKATPSPTDKAK